MTVSTICNYNVATIGREEDVLRAAILMREAHVGDLIVTEQRAGRTVPIGVITDRDIVVGVVAKNIEASSIEVGDTIRGKLIVVREDNGIGFALREMRKAGVRRVPVVNAKDELVAVVSIDDAIDHIAAQLGDVAAAIRIQPDLETRARP